MPGKGLGEAARNAAPSSPAGKAAAGVGGTAAAAVGGKKVVESTGGRVQTDPASTTEPAAEPGFIDSAVQFATSEPWVLVVIVAVVLLGIAAVASDD